MAMAGGRAGSSSCGQNEHRDGEVYFYWKQCYFFSWCIHLMVYHLEMCVCGGEAMWVCLFLFSVEVFLRAGGAHPTCTRLKAKKLCSERC